MTEEVVLDYNSLSKEELIERIQALEEIEENLTCSVADIEAELKELEKNNNLKKKTLEPPTRDKVLSTIEFYICNSYRIDPKIAEKIAYDLFKTADAKARTIEQDTYYAKYFKCLF